MKVILSRKGFDSEFGGFPSPILPDGRMISLPIPSDKDSIFYSNLSFEKNKSYYDLMKELGILTKDAKCHLDPDICKDLLVRDKEWKPLFGQIDAAQTHLENQGVKEGDIFLFFGSFKKTKYFNKSLKFDPKEPVNHIIFGYLQIGEKIKLDLNCKLCKWMEYHPHAIIERRKKSTNVLYVARDRLSWNKNIQGAGVFSFNKDLVLTKDGHPKSHWDLPSFFKNVKISYHCSSCWKDDYFVSRGRGQEFVIEDEKIEKWAKKLIFSNASSVFL